jgi:outer membrane protein TolC
MAVASQPGGGPLIFQDVRTNYDNELTLGIGVNQTLFDAGAIANYNKARIGTAIREQSLEATRLSVLCAAKKLYAQAQLALMVVEIMDSSERLSQETYQSTERRLQAGTATELDRLMAEVDLRTKSVNAAEARKNAELVLVAFRNLARIPLTEVIVLTEDFGELPPIPDSPELQNILSERADYRALVLAREVADIDRRSSTAAFLPSVTASFSYGFGGMGNGSSFVGDYDFNSASFSINVRLSLFTGGYRLARMREAAIGQERANLALARRQDAIESELTSLQLRFDEAALRVESASLIVDTAQRAVTMSQTAYANGLATQLSVAEAVNRLDQARLGLQNAIFEYRSAFYDWELAVGVRY